MAPQMQAAMQAHIAEHVAFLYRVKLEEQLGVPLPSSEEPLPEEIEVKLSRLVADASEQLLQQSQNQVAQQQAQEEAESPVVKIQQKELQLKEAELNRKVAKDQVSAQLEAARIQSQAKQATDKLLASAVKDDEELRVKQLIEGAKIGSNLGANMPAQEPADEEQTGEET